MTSTVEGGPPRKKFLRCPKCNEIIKQNESFCRKCGEYIKREKNTGYINWPTS